MFSGGENVIDWNSEFKKAVNRIIEVAIAVIRKDGLRDKPYCVYSETTGRKFGCYKTKKEAKKRLAQIKQFKHINRNDEDSETK